MDQNDDHVGLAQSRLIEALKSKPNTLALVDALVTPLQELEEVFWDIRNLTDVENAIGEQQDVLGRLIAQSRSGFDDATYKLFLKAKVKLNRSSGTVPEIIEIFQLILPDGADVELDQLFPKTVELRISGVALTDEQVAIYVVFLKAAVDAAVKFSMEWSPGTDAETFAFEGPEGLGFGDTDDPDVGGMLSGLTEGD